MRFSGRIAASILAAALLAAATSAFAANTYLTNPLALQYSGTDFTNLTADYYNPTALIVTSGCNASATQFQAARAQGAEVLEYIDPVELPSWNCTQGNTFYTGASSDEWSPARMNGSEPLLDITAGSTWTTDVVNYVTTLMNSGTVDGVFVDVVGARLWTSVWGDMSTTEQNNWTLGAIDLVRRLDAARRANNPKFIIVNNNTWDRGDAVGFVGEWYVDGICLEHHPATQTSVTPYAARDYTSLGHRRMVSIAVSTSDAVAWSQIQGITHVSDQYPSSEYQTPNAPAPVSFNVLNDLAYTAQFFGSTSASGTTPSAGLGTNFKRGSKFSLATSGTLIELSAYMDGAGASSGTQSVRMELYADSSGLPAALVASSDERVIPAGMAAGWVHFTLPQTSLTAGSYWIVIHSGDTTGIARDYGGSTANTWYGNSDTYSDGGSNPFGTGTLGTGPVAAYATYIPPAQQFGRTTIATTPSAGLGTNFKRGSMFTLGAAATLSSLNAYLDGNGGASGTQQLRMELYRDSSGTPGAKVAQSAIVSVSSGQSAGWVSFATPPVSLTSGSYWIVIHSGDTSAVARDYGDGASDWYGNADTFSDGGSDPFGSGTPGTVTLSVFASYY